MYFCTPSTREAEAGGSSGVRPARVALVQPGLHSEILFLTKTERDFTGVVRALWSLEFLLLERTLASVGGCLSCPHPKLLYLSMLSGFVFLLKIPAPDIHSLSGLPP